VIPREHSLQTSFINCTKSGGREVGWKGKESEMFKVGNYVWEAYPIERTKVFPNGASPISVLTMWIGTNKWLVTWLIVCDFHATVLIMFTCYLFALPYVFYFHTFQGTDFLLAVLWFEFSLDWIYFGTLSVCVRLVGTQKNFSFFKHFTWQCGLKCVIFHIVNWLNSIARIIGVFLSLIKSNKINT